LFVLNTAVDTTVLFVQENSHITENSHSEAQTINVQGYQSSMADHISS